MHARVTDTMDRFAPEVRDLLRDLVASTLDEAQRLGRDRDAMRGAILAPPLVQRAWRDLTRSTRRLVNAEITRVWGSDWCGKSQPRMRFEVATFFLVAIEIRERIGKSKGRRNIAHRPARSAHLQTYLAPAV